MDTSKKLTSGLITGAANTVLFYPIDVLRVRLFLKHRSVSTGLSNGLSFSVLAGAIKNLATYPVQEIIQSGLAQTRLSEKSTQVYSGMLTGIVASVVGNPINAIKVPLQSSHTKKSTYQVVSTIYKNYGVSGFFRGGWGLFARDFSWATVYFSSYGFSLWHVNQLITPRFNKQNEIVASLFSGAASMVVAYPFDGMRLYRQYHKNDYNIWHGFRASLKPTAANIRSFTTGLVRVPLSITFSHISYLAVKEWL